MKGEKRKYWISKGRSRFAPRWKNEQLTWEDLTERLSEATRTQESYSEYIGMSKTERDGIKDVGGFVGGYLTDGRRSSQTIKFRSVITLDADNGSPDWWSGFADLYEECVGNRAFIYTTHKHCETGPRFRLIIPCSRDVSPDEYEAVSRMIAKDLGIDFFDDTTYQASRLMYWPSVSLDGEYRSFELCGGADDLDPDEWLGMYPDWKDVSSWPVSSRVSEVIRNNIKRQEDPKAKTGIIGAFCRAYDVPDAIEAFLDDVYEPLESGRYTYRNGSTAAGVVIYENGSFAYSNHATDPAGGILCNAFDLVRIHRFGDLDTAENPNTPTSKRKSYKAMLKFATDDIRVGGILTEEAMAAARSDFADGDTDDETDILPLDYDSRGLAKTIGNVVKVIHNDRRLRSIHTNLLSGAIDVDVTELPWSNYTGHWSDSDEVQLAAMLESMGFDNMPKQKITDGVQKWADDHARHPVRDYLDSLEWDGVLRVDSLLIDYLGAEDTKYVRAVTRKTLCAAVKRVREPGCKHDTMLVLNGKQGCGKSTLIARLGKSWFNDSLSLADVSNKAGPEKLQGYWILEIGELAGMRKAEVETLRSFLSRQDDVYREAYARRPASHPRQNIFIGTTNAEDSGYLRDPQGNRRFLDVRCTGESDFKPWDLTEYEVDQIWAEAQVRLNAGEPLTLDADLVREAQERQRKMIEADPREGIVIEYLDTLLPEDWYQRSPDQRRSYYEADFDEISAQGVMQRTRVCPAEIWNECFKQIPGRMSRHDSFEVNNILKRLPEWESEGTASRVPGYGLVRCFKRKA